jgi:hypothetical protein
LLADDMIDRAARDWDTYTAVVGPLACNTTKDGIFNDGRALGRLRETWFEA